MRSLLIAVAGTAVFGMLLSAIPDDADARGRGKSARGGAVKVASAKKMGGCGTYIYWKAGRCEDARNKK